MTLGEIVTRVYTRASVIQGIDQFDIIELVDAAHARIHREFRIPEALNLTPQTVSWAVEDGTVKDVSDSLTRWAARPQRVTESDSELTLVPLREIRNSTSTASYAVSGNYMVLSATPTIPRTFSVTHYARPSTLRDNTDEPSLADEFCEILVQDALRGIWSTAAAMETNPTLKRGFMEQAALAERDRLSIQRDLVAYISKQEGMIRSYDSPAIWEGVGEKAYSRHSGGRRSRS